MLNLTNTKLRSFRRTVVVLVWTAVCVPVAMFTAYQLRDNYEQRIRQDQLELEHRAERASFALSQRLHQLMSDLDSVASDGSVIQSLSMPILSPVSVKRLRQLLDQNPAAESAFLVDQELFPVEVLPSSALAHDLGPYTEFLKGLVNSPGSISDPRPRLFVSPSNELVFARPILSVRDSLVQPFQVAGLLLVIVSPEALMSQFAPDADGVYQRVQLLDSEQLLYENSVSDATDVSHEADAPLLLGRQNPPLQVAFGSSTANLWHKVLMDYRTPALVIIGFGVLMLIVVRQLAHRLSRPLQVLSDFTAALNAHKFDEPVVADMDTDSVHYQEFAEVFGLLRKMESTISEQFRLLHQAKASLEDKVVERTAELEEHIDLLNQQRHLLENLMQFAISVQSGGVTDDIGSHVLNLAQQHLGPEVGIHLLRSDYFPGFTHFGSLANGDGQRLQDEISNINSYTGLQAVLERFTPYRFFPIGTSDESYQGFLVTPRQPQAGQKGEATTILCTMLNSALRQHNLSNRLKHLAHTDPVTGLFNRHYFTARFKEMSAQAGAVFSLCVVDVNGLKYVNDHHGHEQGDEMLKTVAQALGSVARASDTVARVGGDEFYLLLAGAGREACQQFTRRLEDAMQPLAIELDGVSHPVSFSYGFASSGEAPASQLVAMADERMYQQKQAHYRKAGGRKASP